MKDKKLNLKDSLTDLHTDFNDDDEIEFEDLEYEDLSPEDASLISERMLADALKVKEQIVYINPEDLVVQNFIELRSPDDGIESLLKKRIKEMINEGQFERKDFIEYLDGDNEQARKMINTYPKKKDFKMEELIVWVNFLGFDLKIVPDPDKLVIGELRQNKRDDSLVTFENREDFIPIKQILVELINKSGLMIKNVKHFFSDKPSDAYNIIERFKKNLTMTTDTFALWLTLIGYDLEFVERGE